MDNTDPTIKQVKECLVLIRDIARRGVNSDDTYLTRYALVALSNCLLGESEWPFDADMSTWDLNSLQRYLDETDAWSLERADENEEAQARSRWDAKDQHLR